MTDLRDHLYRELRSRGEPGAPGDDEEPTEPEQEAQTEEPVDGDGQFAWALELSPEDRERAMRDPAFGQAAYEEWVARQQPADESAPPATAVLPPGLSMYVLEYEAGARSIFEMPEAAQAEALRRQVAQKVVDAREKDRLGIRR